MNRQEKLDFINSVPPKLAMTYHRGYEPDWFIKSFYNHNSYESRYDNPKYIKVKFGSEQRDYVLILQEEDENRNYCKYFLSGRGSIICDSLQIQNELLWSNGYKDRTIGTISYQESTEEDLIDWMYAIALTYYNRDIKQYEEKLEAKRNKKELKQNFAKTYFKL